jgi:hypothetical protein
MNNMAETHKPAQVTRREFYGALALVWVYITLLMTDRLGTEWRWSTGILLLASSLMMCSYLVMSLRADRTGAVDGKTGLPPSDRVKEIARDPARKIEAIQVYREETGAGLAEAKEVVEAYITSLEVPPNDKRGHSG